MDVITIVDASLFSLKISFFSFSFSSCFSPPPLSLFLSRFISLAGRNFHAVARNRSTIDLVEDEEEDYEVC